VQDFLTSQQNVVAYCDRMRARYFEKAPGGESQEDAATPAEGESRQVESMT
jgi:hypothetical protein